MEVDGKQLAVDLEWFPHHVLFDRIPPTKQSVYQWLEEYESENKKYAICLITVNDCDFSVVKDEPDDESKTVYGKKMFRVSFDITIDSVYEKTTAFDLTENQTLTVEDNSSWARDGDTLIASYLDYYPLFQKGARYIVAMSYSEELGKYGTLGLSFPLMGDKLTHKYIDSCNEFYVGGVWDTYYIKRHASEYMP